MNVEKNKNAVNYITNLISNLLGDVNISADTINSYNYCFTIKEHNLKITFGRSIMDDFQSAIEKNSNTDQYRALENSVKFQIYITLGKAVLFWSRTTISD